MLHVAIATAAAAAAAVGDGALYNSRMRPIPWLLQ